MKFNSFDVDIQCEEFYKVEFPDTDDWEAEYSDWLESLPEEVQEELMKPVGYILTAEELAAALGEDFPF